MAEHLTENQKKRVRFSPFTFIIKTCGRMVNAALLKSVTIMVLRVQIPPRPINLRGGMVDAEDLKSSID
jgi:hypothetical protein